MKTHQLQPAGVVAEVARADPSEPGGEGVSTSHKDEILYAHQHMIMEECNLHACKATSDPDTLYYHQAMKQSDADQFRVAIMKEWQDQRRNGNFKIVRRTEVPDVTSIFPSVRQMRRKREVSTGKIKKYKVRMNVDGDAKGHRLRTYICSSDKVEFNPTDFITIDNEWMEDHPARLRARLSPGSHRERNVYEDTNRY